MIPGIQAFLHQIPAHAIGIISRGVSQILLPFLYRFLFIFPESVSKRKGGNANVGLREDLIGFQIELSYRLKVDT